jgi:hypothetical protein
VTIHRFWIGSYGGGRKINARVTEMRHFGAMQLAEKLEAMTHQILDSMAEKMQEASLIELVTCSANEMPSDWYTVLQTAKAEWTTGGASRRGGV